MSGAASNAGEAAPSSRGATPSSNDEVLPPAATQDVWRPRGLGLPPGSQRDLEAAGAAIEAEHRDATRWKRLRCRRVTALEGPGDEGLFEIEVGGVVAFDWTWEGSSAFRPPEPAQFMGIRAPGPGAGDAPVAPGTGEEPLWSATVIEVDEATSRLFVVTDAPGARPTTGTFFVRPFEFLANLERIYRSERLEALQPLLPPLLRASRGGVHPRLAGEARPADPDASLEDATEPTPPAAAGALEPKPALRGLLDHQWGILWGPPGTGKTYSIGELVAALLADSRERVLVVSTTNKATDNAAVRIAQALRRRDPAVVLGGVVRRVGIGARCRTFDAAELPEVLWGGASEGRRTLAKLDEALATASAPDERARLRREREYVRRTVDDGALATLQDGGARGVITTAYGAVALLTKAELAGPLLEERLAPFTTVVIDEAGLISRAAVAALALHAARRVLLVGDPQQLAPIARLSRILPSDQAAWLGASGLDHLVGLGAAREQAGAAREQPSAGREQADAAREQPGAAREQAGAAREQTGAAVGFAAVGDGSGSAVPMTESGAERPLGIEVARAAREPRSGARPQRAGRAAASVEGDERGAAADWIPRQVVRSAPGGEATAAPSPPLGAVVVLEAQHRMHPEVRAVVSEYQYAGRLRDAAPVVARAARAPQGWGPLGPAPRALWYVMDEDGCALPDLRARRGPGGRSWVRPRSLALLGELLAAWPELLAGEGLFLSPFVAQAQAAQALLGRLGARGWTASTVHSQQGAEADLVVFDTVHAGSAAWGLDDWRRLVNVALSRAKERVLVVASRHEMAEPSLRPLLARLGPVALDRAGRRRGQAPQLRTVRGLASPERAGAAAEDERLGPVERGDGARGAAAPHLLGAQLAQRRALRPLRTNEQERLIGLPLDGRARVVRGVAGSGKTLVLASWLVNAVRGALPEAEGAAPLPQRVWVVYANAALRGLIVGAVERAWRDVGEAGPFPWRRVELYHALHLLDGLLSEVGLPARSFGFDFDRAAAAVLERAGAALVPRCDALFVDEAQDMGPETLRLLSGLVRPRPDDPRQRQVLLFYDDAQNLYGRAAPRWSELGLEVRGRSTVLKESHRSTRPIAELAVNVLYRLQPPRGDPEHRELVRLRLIEPQEAPSAPGSGDAPPSPTSPARWWRVRFCDTPGPLPTLETYRSRREELAAVAARIERWVLHERVRPGDVRLVYNGLRPLLEAELAPRLARAGIPLEVQTGRELHHDGERVIASTPHSFKGHDAEVLIVVGLDTFHARRTGALAKVLYVAMTRARSLLALFATRPEPGGEGARILRAVEGALDVLYERPAVEAPPSPNDVRVELLVAVGREHRAWLDQALAQGPPVLEPLLSPTGEVLGEPLFWFERGAGALFAGASERVACFLEPPARRVRERLEEAGVRVVAPGDPL